MNDELTNEMIEQMLSLEEEKRRLIIDEAYENNEILKSKYEEILFL